MNAPMKVVQAIFYSQSTGVEPVREWLLSLSLDERKTIGARKRMKNVGGK